jgi:hypothetical protein
MNGKSLVSQQSVFYEAILVTGFVEVEIAMPSVAQHRVEKPSSC